MSEPQQNFDPILGTERTQKEIEAWLAALFIKVCQQFVSANLVDADGNPITALNPLPVTSGGGSITPPVGFVGGTAHVTTPGTAVPLSGSSVPGYRVRVCAIPNCDVLVWVGGSGVSAATQNGIQVYPNAPPVTLEIDDLSKVYIDSDTGGSMRGVTFIYEIS